MIYENLELNGYYKCVEPLGEGGISVVWLAIDKRFDSKVAIKKMQRGKGDSEEKLKGFSQLFEKEAKMLGKLEHDAFPRVRDFFHIWDISLKIDAPCIVMDFISGKSVFEKLKNNPLSFDEVISLTNELLEAIEYLHKTDSGKPRIIHRDIKPENLKYSKQGKLKILDFGLAKEFIDVHGGDASSKSYPGSTLPYAPLEQGLKHSEGWWDDVLKGHEEKAEEFAYHRSVPATDIFSIGATLYCLLSGKPPTLDAASRAAVKWSGKGDPLKPIDEVNKQVPKQISQIIHKALELEITDRYQDVESMRADFESYFEEQKRLQEAQERENLTVKIQKDFDHLTEDIETKAIETKRELNDIIEIQALTIEEKDERIKQLETDKVSLLQTKIAPSLSASDGRLVLSNETEADWSPETRVFEAIGLLSPSCGILGAVIAGVYFMGTNVLLPYLGVIISGPLLAALAGYGCGALIGSLLGIFVGMGVAENPKKLGKNKPRLTKSFSSKLAIDLGTAYTLVYAKSRGIVIQEPTILAVNKVTNLIEGYGRDVIDRLKDLSGNIQIIHPIKNGVITDVENTIKMLQHLIIKVHGGKKWVSPRVLIGVPTESSQAEHYIFKHCAYQAQASEVYLVKKAIASAIGTGFADLESSAHVFVDIGAGVTEIAVISFPEIVYSRSIRIGGNDMDEDVMRFIKRNYNLLIGERTAEAIKIALGSAFPLDELLSMDVRGRNLIEGLPKTITISDEEIREALSDAVTTIINAVRVALERMPPELSADIVERGIILTGGGALLKNLDKRLMIETGLPCQIADDPTISVVIGLSKIFEDSNLFNHLILNNNLVVEKT